MRNNSRGGGCGRMREAMRRGARESTFFARHGRGGPRPRRRAMGRAVMRHSSNRDVPILIETHGGQVEEERRCRGCFSGRIRFGESPKAVSLVKRNDCIVCIYRDEAAAGSIVSKEKPFDKVESAGSHPTLLEFMLHPKSGDFHGRVEAKSAFGEWYRLAICALHASTQNRVVAEIDGGKNWRGRIVAFADYVCLREQFRSVCCAVLREVFVEVAISAVKSIKNCGIADELKRKSAERKSVSRRFHCFILWFERTSRIGFGVLFANLRHFREEALFQSEVQRLRDVQNVPHLYPSTREMT